MIKKAVIFLIITAFLFSCGIDENYYLPQVPQSNIQRNFNTEATIILPPIDTNEYYYAQNYAIYYRIYISDKFIETDPGAEPSSEYLNISSSLSSDYSALSPSIDPTNYGANNAASSFGINQRKYFQLELEGTDIDDILPLQSGTSNNSVFIKFPTGSGEYPTASLNGGPEYPLYRSRTIDNPKPDLYFRNTLDLNDYDNANTTANIDVTSISNNLFPRYAYAAMYIVCIGVNQTQFTAIYSKPTLVSIFKLPDN